MMPHRVPLFPAPAAQHHALATQALDAGKHCFVEKPLSLTYDEGAALVRLAETKKKILFVGHILQYHPAVVRLKELINRGTIGKGTKIWHFSHILSGSKIGENCNIGQNVVVGPDVTIGNKCKIQNNVSVYKGVTLEGGVFCGPSMVFTNIYNPRAEISKMDQVRATLGANCTIICGHTIGATPSSALAQC